MQNLTNLTHPILVLIRGLPGSGKSYLAAELQKAIGTDHTVSLDPDTIDYSSQAYQDHVAAQRAEGVDEKLYPYRFLRAQAYQGIAERKVVIWNQPFTDLEIFGKMIGRLQEYAAQQQTSLPLLVVEMEVDAAVAGRRVDERKHAGGHGPSAATFDRFVREYASASQQGYDVLTVQGQTDVTESVAQVLTRISALA